MEDAVPSFSAQLSSRLAAVGVELRIEDIEWDQDAQDYHAILRCLSVDVSDQALQSLTGIALDGVRFAFSDQQLGQRFETAYSRHPQVVAWQNEASIAAQEAVREADFPESLRAFCVGRDDPKAFAREAERWLEAPAGSIFEFTDGAMMVRLSPGSKTDRLWLIIQLMTVLGFDQAGIKISLIATEV